MYYYHPHGSYPYVNPYAPYPYYLERQQGVRGQATWTQGGQVTQCGIPWSKNRYMSVAVAENAPYQCGQTLKVRNITIPGREVIVTVVDKVPGFPPNRINLHRKAFETLGANPDIGVLAVEIIPSPDLEQEKWGKYLLELTQTAYPNYDITDYSFVEKTQLSPTQTKETYDYVLQSPQENAKVRANVLYNPETERVISFDLAEL